MAATTMFPKLGYVPTSPKMEPASPPLEIHEVESHWGGEGGISIEVHDHNRTEPHATTCTFCTHLANRLDAKIAGMRRARRHVPYGLLRDADEARREAHDHTTRDADRHLVCPRLRNHTCDMCGHKGHTRSRCAPCGYCGEVGHIHNECPKALVDERAKGMTVVLKGVSHDMLEKIRALIDGEGTKVHPKDIGVTTDDDILQMICERTKVHIPELCSYGYSEDDEGAWEEISVEV